MAKATLLAALVLAAAFLTGCSTTSWSREIPEAYVPPASYSSFDGAQLQAELARCQGQLAALCARQDSAKRSDQTMEAVGWFLFWPAALAIKNEDHSYAISDLKGRISTLQMLNSQKNH